MLDTNHKNSPCAFAEQLVSYLYDEVNAQEKSVFESHLTHCENCAEELSAFSFVRSSVQQWRTEEFSPMQTPAIEIPFKKPSEISIISTEKRSWFADLRQLFTAQTAVTAVAVLAVCIGLTLFAYNFSGKTEIAEKNENKPTESVVSPLIEQPTKVDSEEVASKNSANNQNHAPEVINPTPKSENLPRFRRKSSIERVSNNTKQTAKNELVAQNSNNSAPVKKVKGSNKISKATVAKSRQVPKLTDFDEVEDNSLRLSDLMAEVENK